MVTPNHNDYLTKTDFLRLSEEEKYDRVAGFTQDSFREIGKDFSQICKEPHLFIVTFADCGVDSDELFDKIAEIVTPEKCNFEEIARSVEHLEPGCFCVTGRSDLIRALVQMLNAGATGWEPAFGENNVWWLMGTR